MEIATRSKLYSGKNVSGNSFSASLEMPFFSCEELDLFYNELTERIVKRAEREGVSAFSKLCVCHCDDELFSLYLDVIFCDKRRVIDLYRICDTRKNGFELPFPKKLKRRGYDGFCTSGNRIIAFRNKFDASLGVKRNDYLSVIEQTEF